MDDDFKKCTTLMDRMLESSEELDELIRNFQGIVWDVAHNDEDKAWRVIRDLAYDLDFYEPDPMRRALDYSFYDKDGALKKITEAKDKLKELNEQ